MEARSSPIPVALVVTLVSLWGCGGEHGSCLVDGGARWEVAGGSLADVDLSDGKTDTDSLRDSTPETDSLLDAADWMKGTDSGETKLDLSISECDSTGGPVPFDPTDEYLDRCLHTECSEFPGFQEFPLVRMSAWQVEWTTSATQPLPPCVEPEEHLLIVRAKWLDVFGDDEHISWSDTRPASWPEAPCDGHCIPSAGKVYLVDTMTDGVRYLGDEDSSSWGPAILPPHTLDGWKLTVSPDKEYVFSYSSANVAATCDGVPCMIPWIRCFIEVGVSTCIHVPLQADPGECPLDIFEYALTNGRRGSCITW